MDPVLLGFPSHYLVAALYLYWQNKRTLVLVDWS